MHYFKRNIGDYHKKAGRLSMLEHGAYTLLLDSCYDREKFPTIEEAIEWCWARSPEEIAAVEFVLSKFFVLSGSVYVQDRVQEELDNYREKSLKNKEIAEAREKARREKRERIVHETCTGRDGYVDEPPPNHKPLTTNQELEEIKSTCDQQAESRPRIPYDEIFKSFAEELPNLPQLRIIDQARRDAIKSRWNADARFQTAEFWRKYFRHVGESKFLMGEVDDEKGQWNGCCFDWLLKPANFKKVIEGNYHARPVQR